MLKTLLVVSLFALNTVHAEVRKGFKYCPKEPQAKDYPCVIMGPQYHIVSRTEISENKEVVRLRQEIEQLKQAIELLELELENQRSKEKPQ